MSMRSSLSSFLRLRSSWSSPCENAGTERRAQVRVRGASRPCAARAGVAWCTNGLPFLFADVGGSKSLGGRAYRTRVLPLPERESYLRDIITAKHRAATAVAGRSPAVAVGRALRSYKEKYVMVKVYVQRINGT